MFVVYWKKERRPVRYFHPEKELQKTVKTAWALPETMRAYFEEWCKSHENTHLRTVPASAVAELMYPSGVQFNMIRW